MRPPASRRQSVRPASSGRMHRVHRLGRLHRLHGAPARRHPQYRWPSQCPWRSAPPASRPGTWRCRLASCPPACRHLNAGHRQRPPSRWTLRQALQRPCRPQAWHRCLRAWHRRPRAWACHPQTGPNRPRAWPRHPQAWPRLPAWPRRLRGWPARPRRGSSAPRPAPPRRWRPAAAAAAGRTRPRWRPPTRCRLSATSRWPS
mmetsp:Transcript_29284/g.91257  ORF Transcript_29284/g.91257 Transcript_29284/m.91257 type:complete len:202 (-) Transcript_29284:414-1019(-)